MTAANVKSFTNYFNSLTSRDHYLLLTLFLASTMQPA